MVTVSAQGNQQNLAVNQNNNNLPIPQAIQNQAAPEIGLLFNQAVNQAIPAEERTNSFNALLILCPPESEEAKQLNYLQTKDGENLLTHAIRNHHEDWLERLQPYPNLFNPDTKRNTPLHIAAESGAVNTFFALLKSENLHTPNRAGQSAVHVAIEHGQTDIIRGLLKLNLLKPDTLWIEVDDFRFSLVAYALFDRQFDICDLLLKSELFDKDCWTEGLGNPLHLAAHYGLPNVCEYFRFSHLRLYQQWGDQPNTAGQTPLHVAACKGHAEVVRTLYEQFSKTLETADKNGHRPIHAAAFANKADCVELLVALGCKEEYFRAALAQLRQTNSPAMVNFMENLEPLLDNPERRQQYGNFPVRWAALKGGGAKGPALIGFLDCCQRLGHKFDGYSGTSIGAIVATLSAVGYSPEELDEKFIEKSFEDFLDHPLKGKSIEDLLPSIGTLLGAVSQLRKFVSHPLQFGMDKGRQIFNSLLHIKGLCPGEELRKWVEDLVHKKTGVEFLTYGELAEKKVGRLPNLPVADLFVNITSIKGDGSTELICMNTVDPEWKNHIISDGARSSAGYPGAYVPHAEYTKVRGERKKVEGSMHVDGGMVCNDATPILDQVRFIKKNVEGLEGMRPEFNRGVIAAGFLSSGKPPKVPKTDFTVIDLLKGIIDTYLSAEEILKANPYYETRRINIPVKVGTISFPSKDEKREMIKSGLEVTQQFFAKRDQQRLAVQNFISISSPVHRELLNAKYSVPPTLQLFSGRHGQLSEMANTLVSGEWKMGQPAKELLIYGSEGMGKSVLATAFANGHRDHFKLIWTIDCHDPEVRAHSYRMLAEELKLHLPHNHPIADVIRIVHGALDDLNHPWLLIFDDVQELPERPQSGSILFTSRTKLEGPRHTVHAGSFALADVEELIQKGLGKADRSLASRLMEIYHSQPSDIEQAVRRMSQSSLPPEEYLETLEKYAKLNQSLIDLRNQKPAAFEFLENLAYLKEVPKLFFEAWMKDHFPGEAPEDILDRLFKDSRIQYAERTQTLSIRSATAGQLIDDHKLTSLAQERFNGAFQALQNWAQMDPLRRGQACAQSISFAEKLTKTLWENAPQLNRAILCHIVGNWAWANHDLDKALALLDLAVVLYPGEVPKKIELELSLVKALLQHESLPALLNFAIYFSHLPRPFFSHYLNVESDKGDRIFQNLVGNLILRDSKKFIEIKTDPSRVLLENQGGYQQGQLNEALAAYVKWLQNPAFNLAKEGESCRNCISSITQSEQLATLWNRAPADQRVEVYVRSAQWLNKHGEAPQQAVEAYQAALTICPEGRRKEEINSELHLLLKEQTKKLKPSQSEAPQPKKGGGLFGMFKRNN